MTVASHGIDLRVITRGVALALVLLLQIVAIDGAYSFRTGVTGDAASWQLVNETLQVLIYVALYSAIAFCVLAFAHGREIVSAWVEAIRLHRWWPWFGAQLGLFGLILLILPWMQNGAASPPWALFGLWLAASTAMMACAAFALAPLSFWRELGMRHLPNAVAAIVSGASIYAAVTLGKESWRLLSDATLGASYWLLSLFEPEAFADPQSRVLGAADFRVIIDAPCSGYEGIGLVLGVLGFYIFAFRRELRFPHVLALLPIGALTIWALNAVRLAMLVSLGAHVSPDLALQGFHSQAGWIFFLLVTISLMVVAHRSPALRARAPKASPGDPAIRLAAALLIPFAALMGSRIIGSIFGEGPNWPASIAIAIPAAALLYYRHEIGNQLARISFEPLVLGIAVGAFWIVTHEPAGHPPLARWLEVQPPPEAGAWILLRLIGFAFVVPLAEELAFRGYLHRALIRRRFETAAPHAFGWLAFLTTTLLFGALHQRWLSGVLAGAVFAITLYRSKTLAGPIVAHIAANATIAFYAVATETWDLL